MTTLTIARNDDDVAELTAASVAMLETIADQYNLDQSVTLFETHHGHSVTFLREDGSYQRRSKGQASRLSAEDASFFLSLRGLRWFRCCTDRIEIGFDNCATIILEKDMCSGRAAFANAVYSLQPSTITNYLRGTGWIETTVNDSVSVWHRNEIENQSFELLKPRSKLLKDYNQRIYELICHLEKFEHRSFEQVVSDLNNT